MTPSDRGDFAAAMRTLALSYRGHELKDATVDAYWQGLLKHPLAWVEAGLSGAASMYPRFFPSVGEIEKAGEQAESQRTRTHYVNPSMAEAISQGETHCLDCGDTGFTEVERNCDHISPHYKAGATRRYASPCRCRPSNPIYQAKRAREARQTAARQQDRQGHP